MKLPNRKELENKFDGTIFKNKTVKFPGSGYSCGFREAKPDKLGRGIRGLGMCGHPDTPWPLSTIIEETDTYIIASCDAGCATILYKKPPIKKARKTKVEQVLTKDGQLVEKKKSIEDNILE